MTNGNASANFLTMIVQRWQAPELPSEEQMMSIFYSEGLDAQLEQWPTQTQVKDHRHNLCEILFVSQGELVLNVAGNQILLRQGDRAEVPANTRHSYQINHPEGCRVVVSYRV